VPIYETLDAFWRDWARLTADEKSAFLRTVETFVADLDAGRIRSGLRVEHVQGTRGIYELTWADDGHATFEYGSEQRVGEPHVIWRRIGTHDIFREP
jgi:hypothetical protein